MRKSLQGLDYDVTADGAKGFEDLCVMVENLKENGLDRENAKGWEAALMEGKQYLKADYIALLTTVCEYFGLYTEGFEARRKAEYLSALGELVTACDCCAVCN